MFDLSLAAGAFLVLVFLLILAGLLADGGTRSMAMRGFRRKGRTAWLTVVALSVATAVIMSSLGVGDALKGLIIERAEENLSGVDVFVVSADFVNASQVDALRADPTVNALCDAVEPALMLPVVLHNGISGKTTSRATLYGISSSLSPDIGKFQWSGGSGMPLEDGQVVLNAKAAKELDAYRHQDLYIGLDSPALRKETMFTEPGVDHVNVTINQIVNNEGLGRLQFNVQDVQPAAYMTLKTLQGLLKTGNTMNAVLVAKKNPGGGTSVENAVASALDKGLKSQDLHLKISPAGGATDVPSHIRVTSDRVFFKEGLFSDMTGRKSFISTYFVDALKFKHQNGSVSHVSYSTVTGLDPESDARFGLFTENKTGKSIVGTLNSGEVGITNWTAKELGAKVGDRITVEYSIMDDHLDLIEHSGNFTIAWVADMVGKANDTGLMPDFPGIEGIESCFKWNPPFKLDLSAIQPKDEAYWKIYGGIPKAYIVIGDAERMWGNDQGNVTMVKLEGVPGETVSGYLNDKATVATVGMTVVPIRAQLVASASAMDIFLQMFLAFGSITIAAAIVFVATTFRMMIDERRMELGTLKSLGISKGRVFKDLFAEGLVYSLIGGALGLFLGWLATGSLILGLQNVWTSVIGGQQVATQAFLPTYITIGTLMLALGAGLLLSIITLFVLAWRASGMSIIEARGLALEHGAARSKKNLTMVLMGIIVILTLAIIASALLESSQSLRVFFGLNLIVPVLWFTAFLGLVVPPPSGKGKRSSVKESYKWMMLFGIIATVLSVITAWVEFSDPPFSALGLFVLAGLFITISLFIAVAPVIWLLPKGSKGTPQVVAYSFMQRNGQRTAMTIGIFALIIFSIISLSVIVQVQNSALASTSKEQGGGFDVMAEATKPIGPDLNDAAARQRAGVTITVPAEFFMVRTVGTSGAVCSNMNPQYPPRLMGFDDRLIGASEFKLMSSSFKGDDEARWNSLGTKLDGRIPIFVDENTLIIYIGYAAYEGALGHVFTVNSEGGQAELVVAGILSPSVIAGNFVMHEGFLKQLFPTGSGYRVAFARTSQPATVIGELEKGLTSYGLDARNVKDIVKETTSAEQGYMNLFQAYLGAGLVLGVVALAVTQARQVTERRRDIAMLRAVGISRGSIGNVFYIEAAIVGMLSIAIGIIAGLSLAFTSGPAWGLSSISASSLPILFMISFSIVLLVIILASAALPASRASRLAPISVLREES